MCRYKKWSWSLMGRTSLLLKQTRMNMWSMECVLWVGLWFHSSHPYRLMIKWRFTSQIKEQMDAFMKVYNRLLEGIWRYMLWPVPGVWWCHLPQADPSVWWEGTGGKLTCPSPEVVLTHCPQYLMGGLAEIDVEDWKKNTEYDGYTANDDVIVWFWKVYMPNWTCAVTSV